jgi:transposase-like protein
VANLTLDIFQEAAKRFSEAEKLVIEVWNSACNCPSPGELEQCWNCPYYKKLGLLVQRKLHPNPEEIFAEIPPPEYIDPYSDQVKERCLEMYKEGYVIEDIQKLVGVPSRRTLRNWLREGGLPKRSTPYPEELKQKCLEMYVDRWTPIQIENETGVPADTISDWALMANLSRSRKYPPETQQNCLELYKSGHTSGEIQELTGVHEATVRDWIAEAGIGRPQKRYSPEEINKCLLLYKQGKNAGEIEQITGILQGTIRSWIRSRGLTKASQSTEVSPESNSDNVSKTKALTKPRKPSGYWKNIENIKREILLINDQRGQIGKMPTREEFVQLGRLDLERAISKHHNGYQSVAEQLRLTYSKKRARYWHDFNNVKCELLKFIQEHGTPGIMPTKQKLEETEATSLAWAVVLHGGFPNVAAQLGLKLPYGRKPRNYWDNPENLKQELFAVIEQLGNPGVMPTFQQLKEVGRSDLISAISDHNGWPAVARKLGLTYERVYVNPNDYL